MSLGTASSTRGVRGTPPAPGTPPVAVQIYAETALEPSTTLLFVDVFIWISCVLAEQSGGEGGAGAGSEAAGLSPPWSGVC